MEKVLGDVFNDFTGSGNILFCKIKEINLFKKTNKLQLDLLSDKSINIEELQLFEQFLKNKFQLEIIKIEIHYTSPISY